MIIKNGLIHDAVNEIPYVADIKITDGKILQIAKDICPTDGEKVIDASGLFVYPGLVEAHCHVGLSTYGGAPIEKDVNESSDIISPQMRGIDAFNPFDGAIRTALEAGVTTAAAGPGSADAIGGTFFAVKLHGNCVDDMILKDNVAMKGALGENPKGVFGGKGTNTRMGIAARIRELLFRAKDYKEKTDFAMSENDPSKMPAFDMKLEAMLPVMRGEMPLKIHAHRADDICTAIRIAKEFGVKLTIEHCTDGHLIVDKLAKEGYPVAIGPTMSSAGKRENENKSFETVKKLTEAGVSVSIITDSPVVPLEYLPLAAGLAVKSGMTPFEALKAITINAANHIGVVDRVGSLEVGKDADIVIADGDILTNTTKVLKVILDGQIVVEK